jgi:tRNA pseudouridine13 synthase
VSILKPTLVLTSSCIRSHYELDHQLGLEYFTTRSTGIGGRLRERLDDFVVEEIPQEVPRNIAGEYTHFTLEKRNWETVNAIRTIAAAIGVSHEKFSYAGNKDKRALTTQRVSAWRTQEEKLLQLRITGIRLYDFSKSDFRLNTGDLKGNRFQITVRDTNLAYDDLSSVVRSTCEQIEVNGVPNYFGYQRFGTVRPNTQLVGRELVKGNLEGAVMQYLGRPFHTETADCKEARSYLEETRDYQGALKCYPKRLTYERMIIAALVKNSRDYAGALRRLPKTLGKLLIHAYQSYLFNRMLSTMIELQADIARKFLPVVGYRTILSDGKLGEIQRAVLDREGISPKDFHIKDMPELSSKGTQRKAFIEVNPSFRFAVHDPQGDKSSVIVDFVLPPGSYATVVLRELMKTDPLNY